LRELLNRASGGVVFTTIHKFMPEKGEAMPELSGGRTSSSSPMKRTAASMASAAR
jgi:type I site-specific restriction-modification system R (restriction) subunit